MATIAGHGFYIGPYGNMENNISEKLDNWLNRNYMWIFIEWSLRYLHFFVDQKPKMATNAGQFNIGHWENISNHWTNRD
jgi:hypothetical protein